MATQFKKLLMVAAVAGAIAAPVGASADLYQGYFNTGAAYDGKVGARAGDNPLSGNDHWKFGSAAFFNVTQGGVQIDPLTPGGVNIGDTVRVLYQAQINSFTDNQSPANELPAPNLNYSGHPGTYEITIAADFLETVTSVTPDGRVAVISPQAGPRVALFYDTNSGTFANIGNGTGFTDGTKILDANLIGGAAGGVTTYTIAGGQGTGVSSLNLNVLMALLDDGAKGWGKDIVWDTLPRGWHITTTVQAGCPDCSGAQTVSFFDNANGFSAVPVDSTKVLLADGNGSYTVPEPETVALLGVGLLGLALSRRRKPGA